MSLWTVLVLSLLPGAANFAGGLLAEFYGTTERLLNWALHAASGIVIAIVAVELIPEARRSLSGWWIAAAFGAGGAGYILVKVGIEKLQGNGAAVRTSMWMIYVAVAVDLTSDGLMLGSGAAVSSSMATVLAAGQVLADVPEGYASLANFRDKGVPRERRILLRRRSSRFALERHCSPTCSCWGRARARRWRHSLSPTIYSWFAAPRATVAR